MDEANRFAPPGAAVADVAQVGDVQPIRLWPPSGRMGRLRFFVYGVACYLAFIVASGVLGAIAGTLGAASLAGAIGIAMLVLYLVAEVVLLIQRSHDMNLSGWWSIAALIPFVGLFWLFKSGTAGANRWGAPPPPNSQALRVLTVIFAVLLGIVIVLLMIAPSLLPGRPAAL